jgi:hypothetical protein
MHAQPTHLHAELDELAEYIYDESHHPSPGQVSQLQYSMSYIFPYPEDSDLPSITVPYYTSPKYDRTAPDAFRQFGQRHGMSPLEQPTSPHGDNDLEVSAALMQAWLFFGLMDEVLGFEIDRTRFFVDTQGGNTEIRRIDIRISSYLEEQLENSDKEFEERRHHVQDTRLRRINASISNAVERCRQFEKIEAPTESTLPAVCLSVRLLLLYFLKRRWSKKAFRSMDGVIGAAFKPLQPSAPSRALPLKLLLDRGRTSGMCLRTLYSNGANFDYGTLYYLASLRKSHIADMHQNCTKNTCDAGRSPKFQHVAHHRNTGCNCKKRYPSIEDIVRITRNGGIPLIAIRETSTGCAELKVVKDSLNTSYVAISHVWSDNQLCSEDNGLFECQLLWLTTLLADLSQGSMYSRFPPAHRKRGGSRYQLFWLDSLCVPSYIDQSALRQEAIDRMDIVYAGAHKVLVLDKALQQLDARSAELTVMRRAHTIMPYRLEQVIMPDLDSLTLIAAYIFRSNW